MKVKRGIFGWGNSSVLFVKILYNKEENKLSLESAIAVAAANGELLAQKISESVTYKHWIGIGDGRWPFATKAGRIWYEADINYKTGRRNDQRILWSNDGLIFVTYDHYITFYEII